MEKKIRENAVYISLLPDDVTEEKLGEVFGSIGVIKVSCEARFLDKILIYFLNFILRPAGKLEDPVLTFIMINGLELSK